MVSVTVNVIIEVSRRMQLKKAVCVKLGLTSETKLANSGRDLHLRSSFSFSYTPVFTVLLLCGLAIVGRDGFARSWIVWIAMFTFVLSRIVADVIVIIWQRSLHSSSFEFGFPKETIYQTLVRLQRPGEHAIPFSAALRTGETRGMHAARDGESCKLRYKEELAVNICILSDIMIFAFLEIVALLSFLEL